MDFDILVGTLGPKSHGDADGKKLRDMGRLCAERRICCHHAHLVHRLSFDITYGLFETCI